MAALAAGLDVGLMALTRRAPSGGDRLLTLRSRPLAIQDADSPDAPAQSTQSSRLGLLAGAA
jgi:hypothetical protein